MAKQLLIYESAVPVSAARHADVCVEPSDSFAFSAGVNAVPLMAVEFPRAAAEYAIVFTAEGDIWRWSPQTASVEGTFVLYDEQGGWVASGDLSQALTTRVWRTGRHVLRAHAVAIGRDGARRAVDAELVRVCLAARSACEPGIRVQSQRETRHAIP